MQGKTCIHVQSLTSNNFDKQESDKTVDHVEDRYQQPQPLLEDRHHNTQIDAHHEIGEKGKQKGPEQDVLPYLCTRMDGWMGDR